MRRCPALVALMLLGTALALAGQAPQPPVFRAGVELVDVAVVVVDEDGRFVPGLTAADFTISERGVRQSITLFDSVSIPVWRAVYSFASEGSEKSIRARAPSALGAFGRSRYGARVFVLLLDALHVSPPNMLAPSPAVT